MDDITRVLVIGRRDDRVDYDTAESLATLLSREGDGHVAYEPCFLEEILFTYDGKELHAFNTRNGDDLAEYDAIFLIGWFKLRRHEDTALAISMYAEACGVGVLNSEARRNRSRSKLSQLVAAVQHGVHTTPFIASMNKQALVDYTAKLHEEYPLIVKSASASRGSGNYLVKSEAELYTTLEAAPTKIYLVQTFIPNEGDYRLIVAQGSVKLAIHRLASDGSHLNNTSQGGKATIVPLESLPAEMLADAVTMSEALHREITGVDMIVDVRDSTHYFLEVNNMPQLSTGSFVRDKARVLDATFRSLTSKSEVA